MSKSERQLQEFDAQECKMKKVVQSARQKVEDTKVALQASQVRGTVHKSLMQQSQSGRIKGICVSLFPLKVLVINVYRDDSVILVQSTTNTTSLLRQLVPP